MDDRLVSRGQAVLLAVVLTAYGGLALVGLDFGQPRHFDQSVDAIHPVLSLDAIDRIAGERSLGGIKYPRLQLLVVGAAQRAWLRLRHGSAEADARLAALMGHFRSNPPLAKVDLRESFRPYRETIGELIVVGRAVSALFGAVLLLALFLFTRELFGSTAGVIAAALMALSYPLIFYAHTLNVDVPYLAWGLLALFCCARAVRRGRAGWLVAGAILAILAITTKDQAYGWFLLTAPLVLVWMVRPGAFAQDGSARRFPLAALLLAGVAAILVFLAASGWPFDVAGIRQHFAHILGDGSQAYREFDSSFSGQWLLLGETVLHLVDALGYPLLAVSIVSALWLLSRSPVAAGLCLVPAISYYASFIAPIGYVYQRFTLPIQCLLIAAAAALFAALLRSRGGRVLVPIALLLILVDRGRLAVGVDRLLLDDPRDGAFAWFREHLQPGDSVAVLADLPMHNVDFPDPAQARFIEPDTAAALIDAPPDYLVISTFDRPRKLIDPLPAVAFEPVARMDQLGHSFALQQTFEPIAAHPLLRGAACQPRILIYRRTDTP